jgi:hypothetical protein
MATKEEIKEWQTVVGATPDGAPGRKTFDATINWFRLHGHIQPVKITGDARARVVAIATAELGEQDPNKYYKDIAPMYLGTKPNEKAWCGVFVLWCLGQAGLVPWKWVDGKGFLYRLSIVDLPEPGDIAYFDRMQHHALVTKAEGGKIYTIDGNSMKAPKEGVTENHHTISEGVRYFSIRHLT